MNPTLFDLKLHAAELTRLAGTASTADERDLFGAAAEAVREKAERTELDQACEQDHGSLSRGGALFCFVCGADLRAG